MFVKKKNLYDKFLGLILKKGKKSVAKNILDSAFSQVSLRINMPFHKILVLCFLKLNTLVEVREINSNRRTIFVPFYITFERRLYLVFKWILTAVTEDKRKISFSDKLADEIYNIVSDKTCRSMELKKDNLKKSISYRSNIHYRW